MPGRNRSSLDRAAPARHSSARASTRTRRGAAGRRRTRAFGTSCPDSTRARSEEHTSELQSHLNLVCRLLLEKKKEADDAVPDLIVEIALDGLGQTTRRTLR